MNYNISVYAHKFIFFVFPFIIIIILKKVRELSISRSIFIVFDVGKKSGHSCLRLLMSWGRWCWYVKLSKQ